MKTRPCSVYLTSLMMVALLPGVALSQERSWHPQPGPLTAEMRERALEVGHLGSVMFVLSQTFGPHPRSVLDALADSLIEVTIDLVESEHPDAPRFVNGVFASLRSASDGGHAGEGVPYEGAIERILTLAYRLPPHAVALQDGSYGAHFILMLQDKLPPEEWLAHLRYFATADHRSASFAVFVLDRMGGPEGREILRELYRSDAVIEPRAIDQLQRVARDHGWR